MEEKSCCEHDLEKFVENSKALNLFSSNARHALDKCGLSYDLRCKKTYS